MGQQDRDALAPEEGRILRVLAMRSLLFWGLDVLSVMHWTWDTLMLRGLWAGVMLGVAWAATVVPGLGRERVRFIVGVVLPNVFLPLICSRLGGSANPVFASLCVLPLFALMLPWKRPWEAALRIGLPVVGASAVLLAEGAPWSKVAAWGLMLVSSGTMGMMLSRYQQRLRLAWARSREVEREATQALRASQERALRAERLAQVGRLAAGVAHEVRNPLAYVQANLRYLLEEWRQKTEGGDDVEFSEALSETMQGVERIHQIVKDLTVLSRAEDVVAPVGRCELAPVIDASVRLASVRLKSLVKLAVEVPGTPAAQAEPRRLGQVLLNLLLNAADAIEDGKVRDGRVMLKVEVAAERVRLLVEDNGPGIRDEHLGKLFTTFFTTKAPEKGTGLGLALSREYVESFGGTLHAENRAEGGARFIVDLPAV
ncbi:sensor histidine kinase [Archangium primigenium]|uniref:sensor histidine kinase n=1 Tax=[Archangium] primigenium TaxID=2792470 RepID=UPI00195B18C9|nr:ATP-binding protein [Archangium primigenium]MBM7111920.1 two-component sensor histidine kinase [Archangium primigenium]